MSFYNLCKDSVFFANTNYASWHFGRKVAIYACCSVCLRIESKIGGMVKTPYLLSGLDTLYSTCLCTFIYCYFSLKILSDVAGISRLSPSLSVVTNVSVG